MCPLLVAAERNDVRTCRLCIASSRCDVNIRNRNGKTALMLAAERGNEEVVSTILEQDTEEVIMEAQDVRNTFHLLYCANIR